MGGHAFAADGIHTPRMPPEIYKKVLQQVLFQLRTLYAQVEPLLEAPGKTDFGDIDVLVVPGGARPSSKDVAILLGAIRFKESKGNDTVNYAVPWPVEGSHEQDSSNLLVGNGPSTAGFASVHDGLATKYIQVDVNHNQNSKELLFTRFLHAHGDIWLMIGTMIRPYGLTCSEGGLYIRIPELETWDKKRSRVKLVEDPNKILEYLGLDVARFWTPFESIEQCMDYVSTCRFYNPGRMSAKEEERAHSEVKREEKKYRQRSMFALWLDEYLPAHRDLLAGTAASMTREDVITEAKHMFGVAFAQQYEQQKQIGCKEKEVAAFWADVRKEIPSEGAVLGYAMKGLKAKLAISPESTDDASLRDAQLAFHNGHYELVKRWALANWRHTGLVQEEVDKTKTRNILEAKRVDV